MKKKSKEIIDIVNIYVDKCNKNKIVKKFESMDAFDEKTATAKEKEVYAKAFQEAVKACFRIFTEVGLNDNQCSCGDCKCDKKKGV